MITISLFISGRGYHQSLHIPRELQLPDGADVDHALHVLSQALSSDSQLSSASLLAVCGEHLGTLAEHRKRLLRDGDELVILAPVAGG